MSNTPSSTLPFQASAPFEAATYAKVTWRLIPFLFLCYVVAYLDRVNVGFAKLQMVNDLKFSETVYGLGAGIFFIGYFFFEVPSNVLLQRIGARVWIARIMVTWGIISGAMMFANTPTTFYILRCLLGVAEAGFFPGIILYLTYWYPAQRLQDDRAVHDCYTAIGRNWRPVVRLDHASFWGHQRMGRLAVVVPA